MSGSAAAGRLLVVATPLGNLQDLTARAAEALRRADLVVCEDTRRTRGLLSHLGISTPTRSHHRFNEAATTARLIGMLKEGRTLALVSDAGTPGVSDPGSRLVAAARREGIAVEPIPGPSSPSAAVSASGFDAPGYHFAGFPPARQGARRTFFGSLRAMEAARAEADPRSVPWPIVVFEAPHRIEPSLGDMIDALGDRPAVLFRELSKLHEEAIVGSLSGLKAAAAGRRLLGEITIVIAGAGAREEPRVAAQDLAGAWRSLLDSGLGRKEALRRLSRSTGLPRRRLYRELVSGPDGPEEPGGSGESGEPGSSGG